MSIWNESSRKHTIVSLRNTTNHPQSPPITPQSPPETWFNHPPITSKTLHEKSEFKVGFDASLIQAGMKLTLNLKCRINGQTISPRRFTFVGLLVYFPGHNDKQVGNSEFSPPSDGETLAVMIVIMTVVASLPHRGSAKVCPLVTSISATGRRAPCHQNPSARAL